MSSQIQLSLTQNMGSFKGKMFLEAVAQRSLEETSLFPSPIIFNPTLEGKPGKKEKDVGIE